MTPAKTMLSDPSFDYVTECRSNRRFVPAGDQKRSLACTQTLRVPLSVKSRFKNREATPGCGTVAESKTVLESGICEYCGWLKTLKASPRNSNLWFSPMRKDRDTLTSKLLMLPAWSVLRPTVDALGGPTLSTDCTSPGLTHEPESGLR